MANGLYVNFKNAMMSGSPATVDLDTNDIRQVAVDHADDTPNLTTDDFLDDRAAGSRVYTSGALTVSVSAAVADIADHTQSTVTGDQFESLDWYKHTGTESTSLLIANVDTATGLPCTPNGADIDIIYDSGANKWFSL